MIKENPTEKQNHDYTILSNLQQKFTPLKLVHEPQHIVDVRNSCHRT